MLSFAVKQKPAQHHNNDMNLSLLQQTNLFDSFPSAVYMCDSQGQITYFNQRAVMLWRRTPRLLDPKELFCPFSKAYTLDDQYMPREQGLMAAAVREGRVAKDIRVKQEHPDGSQIIVQVNISPIKDEEGRIIGAINIFQDVTEQHELEKSLQLVNEELKWNTEELEQLAYCASHDLREPLRVASMYIQLLERKYQNVLDGEAIDYINTAVKSCERAKDLLNDLLAYNRVRGKYSSFAQVDLNKALGKALLDLKAEIIQKKAVIICEDLPSAFGDENKISLVFQNLIGNALKFCLRTPEIRVFVKDHEGDVTIGVQDNGIGIDPSYKSKVFEIFQRLHSDEDYSGSGIGLAVCKKILEQHRGAVWFESSPSKGTIFYFSLPAQPAAIKDTILPVLARAASEELLNTPSDSRHIMQVYNSPHSYRDSVVKFLAAGIEKDEGIIVLATQPHWEEFQASLARKNFDVTMLVKTQKIRFIDAEGLRRDLLAQGKEQFVENFTAIVLDLILETRRVFPKFRAFGELVDVFCAHGEMDMAVEAEKVWDQFVKRYDFALFCAYFAANFKSNEDQSRIVDICQNHSHLLPAS